MSILRRFTGLVGIEGSGKSWEAARIADEAERAAIFAIKPSDPAYLRIASHVVDARPREFDAQLYQEAPYKILYRPSAPEINRAKDRAEYPSLETFITSCYFRGDLTMVIDEAHVLCTPRWMPRMMMVASTMGRERGLNIVWCAQSMNTVSRFLRQNTTEFYFWRLIEPLDLDAVEDRCGREVREQVESLAPMRIEPSGVVPGEKLIWSHLA